MHETILKKYPEAAEILLKDRTTGGNIYWATDSYEHMGEGYQFFDAITIDKISGENSELLKPRANKSKDEQFQRTKDKAEVFTPSWICNKQNNLVDASWFGAESPFNEEIDDSDGTHTWQVKTEQISFPQGKSWHDYVMLQRLEITCGEAPYLTSRYDTVTGEHIEVNRRIGLLDRKLRVVAENVANEYNDVNTKRWLRWAYRSLQSTYGFEWQGDNLFLARQSMLYSFLEHYIEKWKRNPTKLIVNKAAEIISWNLWQMDGLTCGLPKYRVVELSAPNLIDIEIKPCERLCRIMEWTDTHPLKGMEVVFRTLKNKKK